MFQALKIFFRNYISLISLPQILVSPGTGPVYRQGIFYIIKGFKTCEVLENVRNYFFCDEKINIITIMYYNVKIIYSAIRLLEHISISFFEPFSTGIALSRINKTNSGIK